MPLPDEREFLALAGRPPSGRLEGSSPFLDFGKSGGRFRQTVAGNAGYPAGGGSPPGEQVVAALG